MGDCVSGLEDKSRPPKTSPFAVSVWMEDVIVEVRR